MDIANVEKNNELIVDTYDTGLYIVMQAIYDKIIEKHTAYGTNLADEDDDWGLYYRIKDKHARIKHMIKTGQVTSEFASGDSYIDNWVDIAGYCIQKLMKEKGYYELPMQQVICKNE